MAPATQDDRRAGGAGPVRRSVQHVRLVGGERAAPPRTARLHLHALARRCSSAARPPARGNAASATTYGDHHHRRRPSHVGAARFSSSNNFRRRAYDTGTGTRRCPCRSGLGVGCFQGWM